MSVAVVAAFVTVFVTGRSELRVLAYLAVIASLALAVLGAVLLSRRVRNLVGKFFTISFLRPLAPIWASLSQAFEAYRTHAGTLVLAYGVGLCGIASTVMVNYVLSQALGGGIPLLYIFLFTPLIDPDLDERIQVLYHLSMDERMVDGRPSGDSRTGRHLLWQLPAAGAEVLAAGASDWVVHPLQKGYPADESYFLHFIVDTIYRELAGHPTLDGRAFDAWSRTRHDQRSGCSVPAFLSWPSWRCCDCANLKSPLTRRYPDHRKSSRGR